MDKLVSVVPCHNSGAACLVLCCAGWVGGGASASPHVQGFSQRFPVREQMLVLGGSEVKNDLCHHGGYVIP